jgi:hypothetical protein
LDDIVQELTPLEQRSKFTQFLNGTKDADKLSGLVEDIRDVIMDYQVHAQGARFCLSLTPVLDVLATGYLR